MSEPTDPTVVIDEVEPAGGRNPLIVALAAMAAVLVGVLLWLFLVAPLFGSDDTAEVAVTTAAPGEDLAEGPQTEEPLEEPVDADADLPLVTYEVFLARDPFDPVVPEPEPEVQQTSATTEDGDQDGDADGVSPGFQDGDDTVGTVDGGGTVSGELVDTGGSTGEGSRSSGCTGDDEMVCDGRVVNLVDITEDDGELVAVIQVDTTIYEVREGEIFAGNFLVQKLTIDQATLVYGDDVVPLREGDRVLK